MSDRIEIARSARSAALVAAMLIALLLAQWLLQQIVRVPLLATGYAPDVLAGLAANLVSIAAFAAGVFVSIGFVAKLESADSFVSVLARATVAAGFGTAALVVLHSIGYAIATLGRSGLGSASGLYEIESVGPGVVQPLVQALGAGISWLPALALVMVAFWGWRLQPAKR